MERKTFYITVGSGEIHEDQGASSYEFEIQATEEEAEQLSELFETANSASHHSFWRAHTPYIQYHHDVENDEYDNSLKAIYKKIYELGNNEAKKHIETMGMLD
ncbi:hydrolase [Lottiidibacillus patelloidae]|uniref:Hydrolase n=1 Tax=Lottiidibacillus patelloidae TaxID=2670334 RepID=A0A263BVI5_9BACI|nr:hydrolase [Lottiidibacillus patelloidae]OZM57337.1 hydrolase [Lottiidibacillus patelloidae]